MPPRRGRSTEKPKPLALGFFGVGEITDKDLRSQLDDLVGDRDATVYLAVTQETAVDTFADVIDWAQEAKVPVTVFANEDGLRRNEKGWLKAADHSEPAAADVVTQLVEKLADSKSVDGRLILFWSDEAVEDENADDGRAYDALEVGAELNVPAYNILKALDLITLDDDGEGEPESPAAPDPEPEPEPAPEKPARRSRSRRAAEPEDEKPAEEEKPARRSRRKPAAKDDAPADEAQADAGQAALDKLEAARKADPKGGQGSISLNGTGIEFRVQLPSSVIDTIADRIIGKLQAEASAVE